MGRGARPHHPLAGQKIRPVRIDLALGAQIFAPRALGGHLQDEVRGFAFLPDLVVRAHPILDPEHDEYVGRHRYLRIALLVVHEQVPRDVHVFTVLVVHPQRADSVENRRELGVVLRHRLAVPARVLKRSRRELGSAHWQAPVDELPGSGGPRFLMTVPQRCPHPKSHCRHPGSAISERRGVGERPHLHRRSERRNVAGGPEGGRVPAWPDRSKLRATLPASRMRRAWTRAPSLCYQFPETARMSPGGPRTRTLDDTT